MAFLSILGVFEPLLSYSSSPRPEATTTAPQPPPAGVTSGSARVQAPALHRAAKKHWRKAFGDADAGPAIHTTTKTAASSTHTTPTRKPIPNHHTRRYSQQLPSSVRAPLLSGDARVVPTTTPTLSFATAPRPRHRRPDEPAAEDNTPIDGVAVPRSVSVANTHCQDAPSSTPPSADDLPESTNPSSNKASSGLLAIGGSGSVKPRLYNKRQRDIIHDQDDDDSTDEDFYIRRHTIADMTVAAYGMVICGTDDMHHRYRGRIEKVKFGVPIAEAFSHDIPATLLVLLLKVNKEGPLKKDIWRAPGNQAQVRKLSSIMQHGRLVNISNISVYTAASVIKKFLSKLPGGIFGVENEQELFSIVQQQDNEQQRLVFCRVICSLSVPSQHLLVLLFGTFRIISDSADTFGTRMTPDAIGISVAPSLFHTCIHEGQRAKLEDVMRFKLASQVISKIIQGFGFTNLFPRECYEFYARITGRTLRVDEHWHFTFQYPSIAVRSYSLEALENEASAATNASASAGDGAGNSTGGSIRRGGSLKAPSLTHTVVKKVQRLSTPANQIYRTHVDEEDSDFDDDDLPPENAPPPPPIDEEPFEDFASLPRHLVPIDDLDLRESASCNF
uniref:Rho-GAP domain-containing protein n=1 Tax=Panagrellus redivivus TaxID=6233 RepID=A0A7E4V6A2_PANRE